MSQAQGNASSTPADARDLMTPDQERWLAGNLWCSLTNPHFRDRPGIAFWDLPITPKKRHAEKVAVKCGRCNGQGSIASFSLRYSGVCFACGGSGVRLISQAAYKKRRALTKAGAAA